LGLNNRKKGFLRISFSLCFPKDFFTGTWFWTGLLEFLFLDAVTGFFHRNSCGSGIPVFTPDSSGFLRIPPDSSGFLFPSKAVWLRPATKEGSMKIDHFQPLSQHDLTMASAEPILCWHLLA
jgi:hypothetical protein